MTHLTFEELQKSINENTIDKQEELAMQEILRKRAEKARIAEEKIIAAQKIREERVQRRAEIRKIEALSKRQRNALAREAKRKALEAERKAKYDSMFQNGIKYPNKNTLAYDIWKRIESLNARNGQFPKVGEVVELFEMMGHNTTTVRNQYNRCKRHYGLFGRLKNETD